MGPRAGRTEGHQHSTWGGMAAARGHAARRAPGGEKWGWRGLQGEMARQHFHPAMYRCHFTENKPNQTKTTPNKRTNMLIYAYLFIYLFLFVYCPHFLAANFPLHHESTCRRAEHICCYLFIFFPFLGPKTKLTRPSCFQSGSRLLGLFCGFFFLPYFPQIELYFHLCHGKGRQRRTHLPCSGCHSMWFKELELGQCLPRASPAGTAPSSLPLPLCCPRAISRPLLEAFGALLAELPLAW